MTTPYHPCVWLAATGLLLVPSFSQVATLPPPPLKADPETIELSPFVVTTAKDVGYFAANTLSGSRLNTPLIDTPASISEMTKEFLEDIGAGDIMAAAEYAMGFQAERDGVNDNTTQFNSNQVMARGLGRSTASRDFFNWGLQPDQRNNSCPQTVHHGCQLGVSPQPLASTRRDAPAAQRAEPPR